MSLNLQHEAFRLRGFRCVNPTTVRFLDGTEATVRASVFRESDERPDDTPRQKHALMGYEAVIGNSIELIDDIELEEKLDRAAYAALPIVDLSVYVGRLVRVQEPGAKASITGFLQTGCPDNLIAHPYRVCYTAPKEGD